MQFIDLVSQRARIEDRLNAAVLKVVAEGKYILGPEVAEFEKQLAEYVGVKTVFNASTLAHKINELHVGSNIN